MSKFFLTVKHWQLFCLGAILFFLSLYSMLMPGPGWKVLSLAFNIALNAITFGWLYSIASNLYPKLSESTVISLRWFWPALFISFAFTIWWCIIQMIGPDYLLFINSNNFLIVSMISLIVLAICLYPIATVAEVLNAVELQQPVEFSKCVGDFFLILFFPIGVWWIQPRINRLFRNDGIE